MPPAAEDARPRLRGVVHYWSFLISVATCTPLIAGAAAAGAGAAGRGAGLGILPVNPNLTSWEGLEAYASLADLPEPVDIVDVFRRPEYVPDIARAAVAAGAGALWLQLRVISPTGASIAADGGLDVVMDRCLAVEHREVVGWS